MIAGLIDATLADIGLEEMVREGVAAALAAATSPNGWLTAREDIEHCLDRIEVVKNA